MVLFICIPYTKTAVKILEIIASMRYPFVWQPLPHASGRIHARGLIGGECLYFEYSRAAASVRQWLPDEGIMPCNFCILR
jgi:hypothetical protein